MVIFNSLATKFPFAPYFDPNRRQKKKNNICCAGPCPKQSLWHEITCENPVRECCLVKVEGWREKRGQPVNLLIHRQFYKIWNIFDQNIESYRCGLKLFTNQRNYRDVSNSESRNINFVLKILINISFYLFIRKPHNMGKCGHLVNVNFRL